MSVSSSTLTYADQIAITEDGKKILLKNDETWEYVKEEPKNEKLYDFRKTNWGMNKVQVKGTKRVKL